MNGKAADTDTRAQALDPSRSFIVQAPAGSGKTGLLIQRYLTLLAVVEAPEEIIAITFTRKAAAEMQSRILAALEKVAHGGKAAGEHESKTLALAQAALKRDAEQDWQILENPARLRIQTIDSLCALITRQMPLLSRLGAQPDILEDPEPLYETASVNTLALIDSDLPQAESLRVLLRHLDNDHVRVRNLLVAMLGKRDQWLSHISGGQNREHLEQALHDLVTEKLAGLDNAFDTEQKNELAYLVEYAAINLRETDPARPLAMYAESPELPGNEGSDLQHWQAIVDMLLTAGGTWRKTVTVKDGFPPAGNKKDPGAEKREHMKKRLLEMIRLLQEERDMQTRLVEIRALPAVTYADNDWEVVQAICDVLWLAAAQLQVLFAEANQMDFNGVAQAALNALGDDDNTTDLALQLDYRIQHLLVDEFQDTSVSQYKLLQRLTAEWSRDDNRSLFLVGDPQQSIYRFREAEVGLFVETFERGALGRVELSPLRLLVNFRSQAGVVDWINDGFSRVFPAEPDAMNGAVDYCHAVSQHGSTTERPLTLFCQYKKDSNGEAAELVKTIEKIRTKNADATVAILVRSRAHLAGIVPMLKQHAIPFSAVEIDPLSRKPFIQDLLMITRAYLHPADRIAWLAVLRAPWCGLELESLLALFNDREKTVFESLQQQDLGLQQNPVTLAHLHNVHAVFCAAYAARCRKSLRQTIESIWCQLGGPATLPPAADMDDVTAYLDLLENLEQGGTLEDMDNLTEAVDQLYAAPAGSGNSVKIMTIHKAKGLEFDHVLIPGLGRRPRQQDTRLLAWWLRHRPDGSEDLLMGPIKEAGVSESKLYQYLYGVEQAKQQFEDARLLYVAITRAIKSVHLFAHVKVSREKDGSPVCNPASGSLLKQLWPVVANEFENNLPEVIEADAEDEPALPAQQQRLAQAWQCPQPAAAIARIDELTQKPVRESMENIVFEWAGETIRHVGTVAHAFIQQIAVEGLDNWNVATVHSKRTLITHTLKQAGVEPAELEQATGQVIQALENIISDSTGRWILDPGYRVAGNEYRVSGVIDGQLVNAIIDRIFVDHAGTRWIIDYKTGRHEGADIDAFLRQEEDRYRPQLEMYARLLQAIDEMPTRLGLYYPLMRQWREVQLGNLS